jgi:hypothetical protein
MSGYQTYWRFLLRVIPDNRVINYCLHYFLFCYKHRKLRIDDKLNSYLFKRKVDGTLLDPLIQFTTDKYHVKTYISQVVGRKYAVETIAILGADEIDDYQFPDDCVLKPTHSSGQYQIKRKGDCVDTSRLKAWLHVDHYANTREDNYRYLVPKLIVEPIVFGDSDILDFKIFCYHGCFKFVQIDVDRNGRHSRLYYDLGWNPLDFSILYPKAAYPIEKPTNWDEMVNVAEKIAANFEFVRVDFYTNGSQCFIGELTHCPEGGGCIFIPREKEVAF